MIELILAHDDNLGIGLDNKLPWHSAEDFQWFRKHTLGKTIVMGRKTYESLGSKPLPRRTNIILSRTNSCSNCIVYTDVNQLLSDYQDFIVVGGAEIYQLFLEKGLIDRMYITTHHGRFAVDTYFTYPSMDQYEITEEIYTPENSFRIYDKLRDI